MGFFYSAKYFISLRIKHAYQKIAWKILKLSIKTSTGLVLYIKSSADWQIYNEIFIKGDYDYALQQSIQNIKAKNYTYHFLDLGSNVGFFALRCIDFLLRQKDTDFDFRGILVEGSLPVFKQLQLRFTSQPVVQNKIELVYGLAGKQEGTAKMVESVNAVTNSVNTDNFLRKKFFSRTVPYINLHKFYSNDSVIDLLKCDIEGSEYDFVENYKHLLKRARVAVFEIHYTKCNGGKCIELIMQSGLINRKTIFNYGYHTSVEVFWR